MQTFAGLSLDTKFSKDKDQFPSRSGTTAIQLLLVVWLILNVTHFCGLLILAHLDRQRKAVIEKGSVILETLDEAEEPSDSSTTEQIDVDPQTPPSDEPDSDDLRSPPTDKLHETKQVTRGKIFAVFCAVFIIFAWVLFLVTAWLRLRSKKDRKISNR